MTVRELIEQNSMIVDVRITVRDHGKLIDELNIGISGGIKPPYPTRVPKKPEYALNLGRSDDHYFRDATYINKSINSWDDGQDYWQVKVNRIPEKWLDLPVWSWECLEAFTVPRTRRRNFESNFPNVNFHGQRVSIIAETSDYVPEEPKKMKEVSDNLEGQIRLEEWLKEVEL